MDPRRTASGVSPVLATMLLVGLTIAVSALAYLLLSGFSPAGIDPSRMQYLRITTVRHAGDVFTPACDDSCIVLIHEGTASLGNEGLSALILRNGERLPANVTTLNGKAFIPTIHTGVESLSGPGSKGPSWDPGEEIWIDLSDGSVKAGDFVTVRIIDKDSNLVISEDTARA